MLKVAKRCGGAGGEVRRGGFIKVILVTCSFNPWRFKSHPLLPLIATKVWLYWPYGVICHSVLKMPVQVQYDHKYKREFLPPPTKLFAIPPPPSPPAHLLVLRLPLLTYSPSACLQHPREPLSHSHIPPEMQGETKQRKIPSTTNTCMHTHGDGCPPSLLSVTRERLSNRRWQRCCVLSFGPCLTFSHARRHAYRHPFTLAYFLSRHTKKNTRFPFCPFIFFSFFVFPSCLQYKYITNTPSRSPESVRDVTRTHDRTIPITIGLFNCSLQSGAKYDIFFTHCQIACLVSANSRDTQSM